jgi:signal transduction histidine kinase
VTDQKIYRGETMSSIANVQGKARTKSSLFSHWPKWLRWLTLLVLVGLVGGATYYYYQTLQAKKSVSTNSTLQTATARTGDLVLQASGSGYLVASSEANIAFEIDGKLAELYVNLGDKVEKGQLLAKVDDASLQYKLEEAQLALLERIAKSYVHLAIQKKVALETQGEPGLPEIRLDPDRMAQVFGNLITNSLRYTPEGGKIILSTSRKGNMLAFRVQDNGKGISSEALPHIFDRFYRADPARAQGSESGLGLAIAKSIVEAHGGSISAESEAGIGTQVNLIFPIV